MRSRRSRPGPRSLAASLLFHALAVAVGLGLTVAPAQPVSFETIEIELVSPPGQAEREEPVAEEELVVETPDPEPPAEETPPPVVEESEDPRPEPEREPAPEEPTPPEAEPEPETRPGGSDETERVDAGDAISVRIEGLQRDYPQYYDNIIAQIRRCFRVQQGDRGRTEIDFVLHSDGTVSDLEFVERSGSVDFDFRAMEAIECAGRPGRIGSFPPDLTLPAIRITFPIEPP